LATRPNNLLLVEGLSLAQAQGCVTLDLGPSDDDQPGLIRFKRSHGAMATELRHLRYVPAGWRDDRAVEVRQLLSTVTHLVTERDVPDEVTARAGAALYRWFA
jgi:hypothetical protein